MELERFADRGHEPASGNWVTTRSRRQNKARGRPVRPAIGTVDLGEAQTGTVPSVKRKNDFVVMVIDERWVYSTSRTLDASRRQQTPDPANLPLAKKEEVPSVLKGKGFKVDLFQTARGTGVGCQSPQERDKICYQRWPYISGRCMTKGGTPVGLFHTKVMNVPQMAIKVGISVRVVSYADDMMILIAAEDENDLAQAITYSL
ncbi:hypothetical protein FOL47_009085 [Perkinsus chesapeaki]|uniref:Uncharacterized protein n=1 Tax=Perkinsus chesapeaki TaxID=330153 RepID=A0A7J6LAK1_PERCH|nr:hypothetical protein FOL47_009085 [Perkinsus chesapeaki]